jgi:hypothetical protein
MRRRVRRIIIILLLIYIYIYILLVKGGKDEVEESFVRKGGCP